MSPKASIFVKYFTKKNQLNFVIYEVQILIIT